MIVFGLGSEGEGEDDVGPWEELVEVLEGCGGALRTTVTVVRKGSSSCWRRVAMPPPPRMVTLAS